MNAAITNWKTSTAGVAFGVCWVAAMNAYHPGMTLKQWIFPALVGVSGALMGILAHDGQGR
jgi:Na+-transporting NADH:ubiquinone oxidoreductase subunit NqrB